MKSAKTPQGLSLYVLGERWYRGRLWSLALEHGAKPEDLASAYNVTTGAIKKHVERYRSYGEP